MLREFFFEEYNRNSDELALKSRSFLPACAESEKFENDKQMWN